MKLDFSRQIFQKYSYIKFNKKSVRWQTNIDMTVIVAFRKIVNAPKNGKLHQNMLAVTNAKDRHSKIIK
jgi:hypothetical protein